MRAVCRYRLLATGHLLLAICYLLISGCSLSIPRLGIGGSYLGGRDEFLKGRGGNMDKAVVALETVVREDPTYKDSLTLLGRAYYRKGRYEDAGQILKRALAVNNAPGKPKGAGDSQRGNHLVDQGLDRWLPRLSRLGQQGSRAQISPEDCGFALQGVG